MNYSQQNRRLAISTPLGEDVLLLTGFTGTEGISRLFRFNLELRSETHSIPFEDIIGKNVTLQLLLADGCPRFFNGIVTRFSQGSQNQHLTSYTAEMAPALWLLTRTSDCRIFQNKAAPEIIKEVLSENGLRDYAFRVQGDFVEREYCVQYRETDFAFVSRLMEEEGIFYFFEHDNGKHTLVFGNSPDVHKPCPKQPKARYELTAGGWQDDDVITEWDLAQDMAPGSYAVQDYNFETPGTDLATSVAGRNAWEIYEYPGDYRRVPDGEKLVRLRLQEMETGRVAARATSDCRAFSSGFRFDLTGHYRGDQNHAYVLTGIEHRASQGGDFRSGSLAGSDSEFLYQNRIECVPVSTPFRPPRITLRPVIHGSQTGVVVGRSGEEIWTDKYGRIKVQFHWDRYGKKDENSSCWIRVAHPWAGKNWGTISLPRVGQEVVIGFLEGDPDRPIVIGSVYNAEQTPPYELPGEQTKSTTKSYSSKGGGGFNEIRFEDKKGEEQIFIHAERNQDVRIKKDRFEWIGEESHLKVGKDQFEEIGGDTHLAIKGDQNEKIDGTVSLKTGQDLQAKVGTKYGLDAGMEIHLKAGTNFVLESGTTLTLKVGGNFINLNPAGVFISGTMVMINSGGAAGSGSGASPQAPRLPKDADTAKPGQMVAPKKSPPRKPVAYSPAATVLQQAAASGTPFCAVCAERAAREAAGQR